MYFQIFFQLSREGLVGLIFGRMMTCIVFASTFKCYERISEYL